MKNVGAFFCSKFGKKFQILESLTIALSFLCGVPMLQAQIEEPKQMAEAWYQSFEGKYEKRLYNLASRDHGKIRDTEPSGIFEMLLTRKDKNPESGRKTRIYLTIYAYDNVSECRSATDFWFKKFIRGSAIRPNRKSKVSDPEASYYILLNDAYIAIMETPCFEWEKEEWNAAKKALLKIFEERQSKALEIECTGVLSWSLHAY